jgi:serine/threonine protein kinase
MDSTSSALGGIRRSLSAKSDDGQEEKKDDWRNIAHEAHSTMPHRRHPHHSFPSSDEGPGASRPLKTACTGSSGQAQLSPGKRSVYAGGSPRQRSLSFFSSSSRPLTNRRFLMSSFVTFVIVVCLTTYYVMAVWLVLETNASNDPSVPTDKLLPPIAASPVLRERSKGRRATARDTAIQPEQSGYGHPRFVTWNNLGVPVLDETLLFARGGKVNLPSGPIGSHDDEIQPKEDISAQVTPTNNTSTNYTAIFSSSAEDDDPPEDKAEISSVKAVNTCVAAEVWQDEAHPNCNSFHELVLIPHGQFLGQGWFRMAWLYDQAVVKMLRLEREYLEEYYELHRRDAVALDHLTFSPFIMNVYGYCGQSAINELADFMPGINALEQLNRRLRGQHSVGVLIVKLRLALAVSIGLYHVHYGKPGMPWEHGNETLTIRPSMAHYDINPRNIAIVKGGNPKLNDFNIAEFLRYPSETSNASTCGFPARLHEPWWRAPEELDTNSTTTMVNEKVDIYALGAVLFHILTTHSPRGKMQKDRMDGVRAEVRRGVRPVLMEPYASDPSPIVQAFKDAMALCMDTDPRKRGTAGEVAIILYQALDKVPELKEKPVMPGEIVHLSKLKAPKHKKKKKKGRNGKAT